MNLRLLADAQCYGSLPRGGGGQVQSHDVAHFRHELRIHGRFERFVAVRLDREGLPDERDSGRAQAAFRSHRARAPERGSTRQRLQRFDHHALDVVVRDLARSTRPGLVQQGFQALTEKVVAPLTDGRPSGAEFRSYGRVTATGCTTQHDPGTESKCPRGLGSAHPLGQRPSSLRFTEARSGDSRV